jgi:hypothetical protein
MNKNEIISKVKFRLLEKYTAKNLLPSEEIINDCIDNTLKAINYTRCCTELKGKEKLTFDEWTESKKLTFKSSGNYINMHNCFVSISEVRQMYQYYIRL